jgi:hypothetical protein
MARPIKNFVFPAKAGAQGNRCVARPWIPAFAGKTIVAA